LLAAVLQHHEALTVLGLSYNRFDAGDTSALSATLQHNHVLTALNLNHNKIGNNGEDHRQSQRTQMEKLINP
jgi:hypothetical protein